MLPDKLIKKERKNKIVQRFEFISQQKNDLYNQLFRQDKLDVDVDMALKKSLESNDNPAFLVDLKLEKDFVKNLLKDEQNVTKICDQINKVLKCSFVSSAFDLKARKQIKYLIKANQLYDANINWVIFELSGGRTLRRQNNGVYKLLLQKSKTYPEDYLSPIKLDVIRTIVEKDPQLKLQKQESIQHLLEAYAVRNPFVAYCQGQNFIADYLLHQLSFEEEDAFWLYTAIIELVMPIDYYTSVVSAMIDQRIMEHYMQIYLPKLTSHFRFIGLECNFFSLNWFMCIFTQSLNGNILKEVFLRLLIHGIRALIITSLVMLQVFADEIMQLKEFSEANILIQHKFIKFDDVGKFRFFYNQIKIHKRSFEFAREQLRQESIKKSPITLTQRNIKYIETIPKCDESMPICAKVIETNRLLRRSFSFFVYQQEEPPSIIPDYLDNFEKYQQKQIEKVQNKEDNDQSVYTDISEFGNLLIGKQYHVCKESYDVQSETKVMYRGQNILQNFQTFNEDQLSVRKRKSSSLDDRQCQYSLKGIIKYKSTGIPPDQHF